MLSQNRAEYATAQYILKCNGLLSVAKEHKFSKTIVELSQQVKKDLEWLQKAYRQELNSMELSKYKNTLNESALVLESYLPEYDSITQFRGTVELYYQFMRLSVVNSKTLNMQGIQVFKTLAGLYEKSSNICYDITEEDKAKLAEVSVFMKGCGVM